MVARVIVLRGLPGSGKSTMAKKLVAEGKADLYLEADMFFENPLTGEYVFDGTKIGEAHKWCQDRVRFALYEGKAVVVSNTATTTWELDPYLKMAEVTGATVEIITLKTQFGSIRGVPAEVVERMKERWEAVEGEKVVEGEVA